MGRKKRKKDNNYFCYYCNRNFEGEKILIQHQKAKHFKCSNCHKKMVTAFALMNHMFQVHKETLKIVPNAREGRDSVDLHIHGMQGVPEAAKREKEEQNTSNNKKQKKEEEEEEEEESEEEEAKAAAPVAAVQPVPTPAPSAQLPAPPQFRGQMFPGMQMPGMPPGFNPMMMGMNPMGMGRGFPMGMGRGVPMPGMPFNPMMMPGMPSMMQGMPPQPPPPQQQQQPQPTPTPPAAPPAHDPPAAQTPAGAKAPAGGKQAIFIFQNELSMEELRAQLPKHKFDPNQGANSALSSLSQSIAQRMADLKKNKAR